VYLLTSTGMPGAVVVRPTAAMRSAAVVCSKHSVQPLAAMLAVVGYPSTTTQCRQQHLTIIRWILSWHAASVVVLLLYLNVVGAFFTMPCSNTSSSERKQQATQISKQHEQTITAVNIIVTLNT
jgi:hypothetical protein